jgi:hypothetical protein
MVTAYDDAQARKQASAVKDKGKADRARRERRLAGVSKWANGVASVHYARDGYQWVNGKYIKVDPRGTGTTQTFSTNRHDERAEHAAYARKSKARHKAKMRARTQYEAVKPLALARLKALKADKQAARLARA